MSSTRWIGLAWLAPCAALLGGCTESGDPPAVGHFRVVVTTVNGDAPPPVEAPLPANAGDSNELWAFTVEAIGVDGQPDTGFDGAVRVDLEPGAVMDVTGATASGRNVLLEAGRGEGVAVVTAMFGSARLWVEDLGYQPAPPGVTPTCANGEDDDGDVLLDHPSDPGCAYADDMSEEGGSLMTGVSQPVHYALPKVADVQGRSSQTPYPSVAVELDTASRYVVVTRVASSGFFVTDVDEPGGYGHLYAYNYNTPEGMRVCDHVTYLTGTASEFFGLTEISFPSYGLHYAHADGQLFGPADCRVPEPVLLKTEEENLIAQPTEMEKLESGLVRIEGFRIASKFGPDPAVMNAFKENQSNCDLNGDGQVDYYDELEGSCSNACSDDAECSEWTAYAARGNYKVHDGGTQILINTGTALGFDPLKHKGAVLAVVSGTVRHFSGGDLNWTIETRCADDLVCDGEGCPVRYYESLERCTDYSHCPSDCVEDCAQSPCTWHCPTPAAARSNVACVTLRTEFDDDQGTY